MGEDWKAKSAHPDEGTIHAWLDGALDHGEGDSVDEHVAACGECSRAAAEARGIIAASTRILTALDDIPRDVIPGDRFRVASAANVPPERRRYGRLYSLSAAAAVLLLAGALVLQRSPSPVMAPRVPLATQSPINTNENKPNSAASVAAARRPDASSLPLARAVDAARGSAGAGRSNTAGEVARVEKPRAVQVRATTDVAAVPTAVAGATDSVTIAGRVAEARTVAPPALEASAVTAASANVAPVSAATVNGATVRVAAVNAATVRAATDSASLTVKAPTLVGARTISSAESTEVGARIRRTVFQLASGKRVTLVERRPAFGAGSSSLRPPALAAADLKRTPSISWVAKDGTLLVLSGDVPEPELQRLESQIVR
ncbi:MAG: zf-HC2 domain-containing protein [Gemmatimonadota bacterium]|nr:zf-HC2 domain-containing protein [Gemmatimonadota bacterium]